MFRLEKVFQNDDSGYILFSNIIKSFLLLISSYVFIILSQNSIYDLGNYKIFRFSNYFIYTIILSIFFFVISFFLQSKKEYKINFISFLKEDVLNIFFSVIFAFAIIFIFKINFILKKTFFYITIYQIIILFLLKLYFNNLYRKLIDIMLVGTYQEIKKIISDKLEKIIILKCCMITDSDDLDIKLIKSEFKFPIFKLNDDFRSILEYHSLGQIWVLNGNKNKLEILSKILKFSVDTLNI